MIRYEFTDGRWLDHWCSYERDWFTYIREWWNNPTTTDVPCVLHSTNHQPVTMYPSNITNITIHPETDSNFGEQP